VPLCNDSHTWYVAGFRKDGIIEPREHCFAAVHHAALQICSAKIRLCDVAERKFCIP